MKRFLPLLILPLLTLAVFAACLYTRQSYTDASATKDIQAFELQIPTQLSSEDIYSIFNRPTMPGLDRIEDLPDALLDMSPVIVRARFTGERTFSFRVAIAQVVIEDVYKGDPRLLGKTLQLNEPLLSWLNQGFISSMGGYAPMKAGSDYLLLLEEKEFYSVASAQSQPDMYRFPFDEGSIAGYFCYPMALRAQGDIPTPLTFGQGAELDFAVQSPAAHSLWLSTRETIFSKMIGG